MSEGWDAAFCDRSPMLEPLRAAAAALACADWPTCGDLNRAAAERSLRSGGGRALRFVDQQPSQTVFEAGYEPRIYLAGEVQSRPRDWHDVFNALVWLTFPEAKAALNARHFSAAQAQRARGTSERGPVRDALTLFDEGGVIVACAGPALATLLAGFQWKELFWRRRSELERCMRFYVFGHALLHKALHPFTGVTGRGVIVDVSVDFFGQPLAGQLAALDSRLAQHILAEERFRSTRELVVVPVLGVPGWCADNERESYYDNIDYFRPGRRTLQRGAGR
jgi:hypothetical protein